MAETPEHESLEVQPGIAAEEAPVETSSQAAGDYDRLAAELQEAKDKHLRLLAEWDNFRRRTVKENFDLVASANAKLLGKLTEVLDDFNLAFDPARKAAKPEDMEKGLRLIYNKFKNILSDEGLAEIDPQGAEFDPNLHDALMQQPSETVPENHVVQVLMKGYKVKDKILKHAKVIVSTGKAS
jgi:molecular chaperone GrpE